MSKLISGIVSLVIVIAVVFGAYEAYLKRPSTGSPWETVTIATGAKPDEIAATLKQAGVISSVGIFNALADVTGSVKNFHPGTFLFQKGISAADALKTLSYNGKKEIDVTIPEGFNLRQVAERLVGAGVIANTGVLYAVTGEPASKTAIAADLAKDYPFLAGRPADVSLEGYLFPETYRFYASTDAETVVRKMLDVWKSRAVIDGNLPDFQTLVMASILEKEVKDPADKAKVANILYRRLKSGMPLQVDSSVNYVTGKNTPSISFADQGVASPYNTYKNVGLPRGPICNPGLDSIRAALSPAPNTYWYFLTTPQGEVIYSRTLDEHNAAVAKYL